MESEGASVAGRRGARHDAPETPAPSSRAWVSKTFAQHLLHAIDVAAVAAMVSATQGHTTADRRARLCPIHVTLSAAFPQAEKPAVHGEC